jgi:bloom syndrome protein
LVPVYHPDDAVRLMNRTGYDDRSQDLPRQEENERRLVRDVLQMMDYCMNISQCRRVQILRCFGEIFHEETCHKRCDVCMADAHVTIQDTTTEAIDVVNLVRLLAGKNTTKHCKAVFIGSKRNRVKEKGHDELLGHGMGNNMGQKKVDQLFGKLFAMEVLRERGIRNRYGFMNYYLQVSRVRC